MWDRDKIKLWSSEIVALTSVVPWFLTQHLEADIHVIRVDCWMHISDTLSVRGFSCVLLLFLAIALIPAFYDNLKNGYSKPNIKSVFYILLFCFPIVVSGCDSSTNVILFFLDFFGTVFSELTNSKTVRISIGSAHFTLLAQFILCIVACVVSFFTKEHG
ncbi:MAG: hypothetical protein ACTSXW_04845 [Candidatus Baldrarchaeia archaeon]